MVLAVPQTGHPCYTVSVTVDSLVNLMKAARNIWKFYMFSEQTATLTLYNINSLVFITDVQSVYSAVRTESFIQSDPREPEIFWMGR